MNAMMTAPISGENVISDSSGTLLRSMLSAPR